MKKRFTYIVVFVFAVLVGCTKDADIYTSAESTKYIGTIETVETRAVLDTDYFTYDKTDNSYGQQFYLDQQNQIKWEVGDLVSIYTDEPIAMKTSGIYKVNSITGGVAEFVLETKDVNKKTNDGCNYGVYPYDAKFDNGVFSYDIPAVYTYTNVASLIKKSLMVAKVARPADETSTVKLNFTNAQSILRLCFNKHNENEYTQNIKRIRLTSQSNYLSGTAEVKWNGATPPSAKIDEAKDNKGKVLMVTLETPQTIPPFNEDKDSHAEVYLPIVPTTFPIDDLTIELFGESDDKPFYTKTISKEVKVTRGAIKGIKLTMGTSTTSGDFVTVKSTEELVNAINAKTTSNIKLQANTTYQLTSAVGKTLHIVGPKSAVLDISEIETDAFKESIFTFEGITIDWGENENFKGSHLNQATFNNCHIKGMFTAYSGNWYFNNCTLDVNGDKIWTYGSESMTFRNCDFYNTCQNAILMYANNGYFSCTLNIHNCHFFANGPSNWGENAVVEIKPHVSTTVANVNFTGHNTKSKDLSWVRISSRGGATVVVTVNGEPIDFDNQE